MHTESLDDETCFRICNFFIEELRKQGSNPHALLLLGDYSNGLVMAAEGETDRIIDVLVYALYDILNNYKGDLFNQIPELAEIHRLLSSLEKQIKQSNSASIH